MPNAPLPKPAAPVPPKPPANAAQPPQPPSAPAKPISGSTPANASAGAVFPPQSHLNVSPPAPTPSKVDAPGQLPKQPQVARPGSPLPTSNQPAPPLPNSPATQPPMKTLSALQSMTSNNLPQSAAQTTPTPAPSGQRTGSPTMTSAKLPSPEDAKKDGKDDKSKKPEFAEPSKSILRFLPYIIGGVLLLGILGFIVFRMFGGNSSSSTSTSSTTSSNSTSGTSGTSGQSSTGTTTTAPTVVLEYWGLWEPSETMQTVIKEYESENPGVSVNYTKQSPQDYRLRLKTALADENGPDIFRYHASWVPMMTQELSPMPSSVMTSSEYTSTFYPVAAQMLQVNSQIVGIPLMYEGLALYYNTDIFSTAVVDPPKTWSDLRQVASKLTVKAGPSITRAGVAMGNTSNVEHFSDILALLMMQNGADMTQPNSPQTRDALLFYTNFIKSDGVWDDTLPLSSVAFARGDVAMIFAPSWRALEIKQMNPNLKFKTVPLPQLSDTKITYGNFWAEGVSTNSTHKEAAWKFLKYLSSAEVQKKLYSQQSSVRPFGEIYSRKDLANDLAQDEVASAYLQDAPYAKSWYMSSATHDDGLNDQVIKYYEDAVNSILAGTTVEDALITLDQGVQQVLRQYGVPSNSASAQQSTVQ